MIGANKSGTAPPSSFSVYLGSQPPLQLSFRSPLEWYSSEYGGKTKGPANEANEVGTEDADEDADDDDADEDRRGMGLEDRLTPGIGKAPSGAGESALEDDGAGLPLRLRLCARLLDIVTPPPRGAP